MNKTYSVYFKSSCISDSCTSKLIKTFDSKTDARTFKNRRNKQLSKFEKQYYKMKYFVK